MSVKAIAKFLYGLFGVIFLIAGVSILLVRAGLLPDVIRNIVINEAQGNLNALHLLQEFGSMLVFAGLISFWFIRHYEQSKAFHWAMTSLCGLLALAHWFDVRGPLQSTVRPIINSLPFILFAIVGVLRKATERRSDELQMESMAAQAK